MKKSTTQRREGARTIPTMAATLSAAPGAGVATDGVIELPMTAGAPEAGSKVIRRGTASTTAGRLGQIVTAANRWRENYNPARRLTIRRAVELLELAQRGDTAYLQWCFRTIERRYPTLSALITRCEGPLLNFDWEIKVKEKLPAISDALLAKWQADLELREQVEGRGNIEHRTSNIEHPTSNPEPPTGDKEEEAPEKKELSRKELKEAYAKAAAERQQATLSEAYDGLDNLKEAIQHLHMAEFRGYAHLQKHRNPDGSVYHLEPLNQWCVCRDGLEGNWFWNPDSRSTSSPLKFLGRKFAIGGDELPLEDFIVREVPRPIDEIALILFIRSNLAEKDADAFLEIYGVPGGVVIMPSNVPSEKASEFEDAARKVAEGGSGALPNGADYKPNDGPRGVDPFSPRLKHLDEQVVMVGTGGKLTMLAESGSGTLAGGAHADTFSEIADGRAQKIGERFQRDFDREELERKHPGEPILVYFKLGKADTDSNETLAFKRDLVKALAGHELLSRVLANQTDLKETVRDVGVTVNEQYSDPYVPVADAAGNGISGELQRDGEGDIIGAKPMAAEGGTSNIEHRTSNVELGGPGREKPDPDDDPLNTPKGAKGGPDDDNSEGRDPKAEGLDEVRPAGPGQTIKNRAAANAPSGELEGIGTEQYAAALAHDLQVVREEMEALLAITDDRVFIQREAAFREKLDALQADILKLPKSAQALAETMIAALFTGLTEGTTAKNAKNAKT